MINDEIKFAPVGNYSLGFDSNGKLIIVPTFQANRTVIVTPPEEYINPEFIVNPGGVKLLIDDRGDPAYSTDAYNIVQEEKHKPLNPYQGYLENMGVAPKDNEVEHLLQRQRANDAAERSDLSPFFANLMTGMYASAAQQGVEDIKNGKYITGVSELASPLMFGENAWNNVAQSIYGGVHLLNDNGVRKTWNEIKNGNYGSAALSGAGDLFNLVLTGVGGNQVYNSALDQLARRGNNWARAKQFSNTLDSLTPTVSSRSVAVENNGGAPVYSLYDEFGTPIGDLITTDANRTPGGRAISWVASKNKGHGITKDLYSTAAYDTEGGLESGWSLMSPEKTMAATKSLNYQLVPKTYTEVRLINRFQDRPLPQVVKGNHYIETGTKPNSDIIYNEITGDFERVTPKQPRMFSEETYPMYTGPKHSISEVVNADGTVNPRAAIRIQHEVADYFKQFGEGAYRMEERLENPEWHMLDPNTFLHTKNVAQTAYQLPILPGFTKQDQMVAALGHDFGKMVAGDGHGEIGAALIKQIFPDATPEQIAAISEHMQANPQSVLGQYTKAADIINGRGGGIEILLDQGEPGLYNTIIGDNVPRRIVEDAKLFGTTQPRQGHISLQSSTNPLQIRLQRLKNKSIEDYDPTTQKILTKPVIRGNDVRKAFKELAPDLTDEQLDMAVQIAFANKRGVHIPIGDSVTSETTGGVSIVDIENAVKYLRESGIANPTPTDVGIIAGHEAGHGVKVTDEALDLVRNYYAPEEFYTQAGQILDAAGVVDTSEPITYNQFMYMLDQYNRNKNLNNGIGKLKDFMQNLSLIDRQKVMKNINRFSVGLLGVYGLKQLENNDKI